jgi:hypothetical protein
MKSTDFSNEQGADDAATWCWKESPALLRREMQYLFIAYSAAKTRLAAFLPLPVLGR